MHIRVYCYLSTQYVRHGVKSEADKKASTAAVRNQLAKVLNGNASKVGSKDGTDRKAKETKPYGTNVKGTNSHYFVKNEQFDLTEGSANYDAEVKRWEEFCTQATNIATRLEARDQYDISQKKERYKAAKAEAFAEIMGDTAVSVSLSVDQKRQLDARLSQYSFTYYESHIMICVISDEIISALSHCQQDNTTDKGEYVYHIRSKTVITAGLLTAEDRDNLGKEASDYIKLIPNKSANKYKTVLLRLVDQNGYTTGYRRKLEAIDT